MKICISQSNRNGNFAPNTKNHFIKLLILTYPRIYPWNLQPKMVSMDNWFHFPCMNMTNTNMLKRMLAIQTLWSLHRRPALGPAYKRIQHWLDLWMQHPVYQISQKKFFIFTIFIIRREKKIQNKLPAILGAKVNDQQLVAT